MKSNAVPVALHAYMDRGSFFNKALPRYSFFVDLLFLPLSISLFLVVRRVPATSLLTSSTVASRRVVERAKAQGPFTRGTRRPYSNRPSSERSIQSSFDP